MVPVTYMLRHAVFTASVCVGSRLLKIREEADPFSMDIGVLRKGHIVKVLEVSELAD